MRLLLLILFSPLSICAQDITGVWTGYIVTSQKQLPYEVIISEEDGNLSGYSHITFYAAGKELVAVKKLKIKNEAGNWILEDDDIIYDNFRESQPRKMKQSSVLTLTASDTVLTLAGTFTTNKTRNLKPATGDVMLQKSISHSTKLFAKLDDLKLASDLSFVKPKKDVAINSVVIEKTIASTPVPDATIAQSNVAVPAELKKEPGESKVVVPAEIKETDESKIVIQPMVLRLRQPGLKILSLRVNTSAVALQPHWKYPALVKIPDDDALIASVENKAILNNNITVNKKPVTNVPDKSVAINKPAVNNAVNKPAATTTKPVAVNKPAITPPTVQPPPPVAKKQADVIPTGSALDIGKRKIETIENVSFKTDSLVLTLYDNGEVDGDTVSVLMNGKVIVGKQGLTTNAYTKTLYITPDMPDSLQLIMYAENLGSLPPNTGLLIIQDGNERHEIRFTGDLQKNAAILLRRRK